MRVLVQRFQATPPPRNLQMIINTRVPGGTLSILYQVLNTCYFEVLNNVCCEYDRWVVESQLSEPRNNKTMLGGDNLPQTSRVRRFRACKPADSRLAEGVFCVFVCVYLTLNYSVYRIVRVSHV